MTKRERDPITGALALGDNEARVLLEKVVTVCGDGTVVAFDLDSTLLHNAPRQARIMREYGASVGEAILADVQASHWNGWDARIPMRAVGLNEDKVALHADPFKAFWRDRFFTSEYCTEDVPIAGAAAFVAAVFETGARVCYVTGRHEPMRGGSRESLSRGGFPVPGTDMIQLVMKPSLDETDDAYKVRAYDALRDLGSVVAAFDNEPAHINGYANAFPTALSVHLATDHSLREIKVAAGIPSIADFSSWK